MCFVAWPAKIEPQKRAARPVHPRRRRRPDDLRAARDRAARGDQGLRAEPDRGRELRRLADRRRGARARRRQFYAMLGQRSIYHEGWLACTAAPAAQRLGQVRAGRLGALRPRDRPRPGQQRRRAGAGAARGAEGRSGSTTPGSTTGCRWTTARRSSRCWRSARTPARTATATSTTRTCADVPEEGGVRITGRSYTIAAGVEIDSADAEGVLYAHGGVAGGHSLYVKDGRLRYTFNWVGTHLQEVVADREITPGAHVYTAEFAREGPRTRIRPCPASPARSTSTWTTSRSAAARSSPSPASSAWSATASASAATAPRRSRPTTRRRSASPAARSTRSSSIFGEPYIDHEARSRLVHARLGSTGARRGSVEEDPPGALRWKARAAFVAAMVAVAGPSRGARVRPGLEAKNFAKVAERRASDPERLDSEAAGNGERRQPRDRRADSDRTTRASVHAGGRSTPGAAGATRTATSASTTGRRTATGSSIRCCSRPATARRSRARCGRRARARRSGRAS